MKWRWLAYAVIATPVLLVAGIAWLTYGIFGEHPVRDLRSATKWTRLEFPTDAKIIDGAAQGANTFFVVAKVRLPQAQVQEFLNQPRLREAEVSRHRFTEDHGGLHRMQRPGWTLQKPQRFVSITSMTEAPAYLWILIDLDDRQTAVLYLYYVN
jgi:hypothetical protein